MILKYYGLREQPFGVAPNPRFIYQGPGHREALASLIYAIESNAGFAALIGRAGLGKTTLIFHLLDYFRQSARTAVVFNTQCSKGELLRYILAEFGETQLPADVVLLYEHFRDILIREASHGRRVIIIIDEAQNLELETMEAVRLLNNFETPECKLLHIILVGQQQLAAKLMHPSMEQLLQRITIICRLAKFEDVESIERYINHRMRTAGYDRPTPLFTADAMTAILRESDGVPRRINRICFNALLLGCALDRMEIDAGIIDEVSRDLNLGELVPGELLAESGLDDTGPAKSSSPGSKHATLFEMPKPKPVQSLPIAVGSSTVATYTGLIKTRAVAPKSPTPKAPEPAPKASVAVETEPPPKPTTLAPVAAEPPVVQTGLVGDPKPISAEAGKPAPAPATPGSIDRRKEVTVRRTAPPAERRQPVSTPRTSRVSIPSIPPVASKKRRSPYRPLGVMSKIPVITALSFATVAAGAWFIAPGPLFRVQLRSSQIAAQEVPAQNSDGRQQVAAPEPTFETPNINTSSASTSSSSSKDNNSEGNGDLDQETSTAYNIWPGQPAGSSSSSSSALPISKREAGRRTGAVVQRVMPVYPPDAESQNIQGRVVVRALIGSNGRVSKAQATEGPKLLADAAVDAVQRWVYEPSARDGRSEKKLVFNFKLAPK